MKRKVTLMILAAVLLSPACGMAAPREGGGKASSGYSVWEIVEGWIASLFMDAAMTQVGADPADSGKGVEPLSELGTTWDANG